MKKKLTLQEKLNRRKFKKPSRFIYGFLSKIVVKHFLLKKFHPNLTIKDNINDCDGPCFLLYNHQSRFDYQMITQLTSPKTVNFVVGYNEFFRSHLEFISKLMHFIPKKNFTTDLLSIKAMSKIIKDNGVVCMAPEGMSSITGHNQPIFLGTGKLLKKFNIPVYMVKINGAYLSNHKVCLDERYGRIDATLSKLFTVDDLKNLSADEIETKINEEFWTDEYEWQKKEHIKWETNGRIATHLHDICYKCPTCLKEFNMLGEGNILKCNSCGAGFEIDDYYEFHKLTDETIYMESPSKWVDWERKLVYREIKSNPDFVFEFDCTLGKLDPYKTIKGTDKTSIPCGEGKYRLTHSGIDYIGTKDGNEFNFHINYDTMPTIGMPTDVTYFSLYYNGEFYDILPKEPVVGKVLLVNEEMHRLHFNTWKNFPWMDTYKED